MADRGFSEWGVMVDRAVGPVLDSADFPELDVDGCMNPIIWVPGAKSANDVHAWVKSCIRAHGERSIFYGVKFRVIAVKDWRSANVTYKPVVEI